MSASPPDAARLEAERRPGQSDPARTTRIEGGSIDYRRVPEVALVVGAKSGTLFRAGFLVTLGALCAWALWVTFWLLVLILLINLSGWHPSIPGSPAGL